MDEFQENKKFDQTINGMEKIISEYYQTSEHSYQQ
jgi:hypothetical protein